MNNNSSDVLSSIIGIIALIYFISLFFVPNDDEIKRCSKFECDFECAPGSSYCYAHKPITIRREDYEPGYTKSKENESKGKSGSGNRYAPTYYSGKSNMPDCDDYDSFEDFMDDWDGYMPGGIDAEDYWENW